MLRMFQISVSELLYISIKKKLDMATIVQLFSQIFSIFGCLNFNRKNNRNLIAKKYYLMCFMCTTRIL